MLKMLNLLPVKSDSNTETDIDEQILHQLSLLSQCLISIECTTCEKSNDPKKIKRSRISKNTHMKRVSKIPDPALQVTQYPSLVVLKQESLIQAQVDKRLKQLISLQTYTKTKSQRGGLELKNRVKWPNEFILTGTSKEWVNYNQLTPVQWMAGCCCTIK